MKIVLTVKEAKMLLNAIYGTQCVANTYPETCMNKPEEPIVLSDEEVYNNIVQMCRQKKVYLYINNIITYASSKPDYDRIAEALRPYDGEIVSIINTNDSDNWYINTL